MLNWSNHTKYRLNLPTNRLKNSLNLVPKQIKISQLNRKKKTNYSAHNCMIIKIALPYV
jgi:hypothetical protein